MDSSDGIPSLLQKEEQINDEEKKDYINLNDVEQDFKLKKKCPTTVAPHNFKVITFTRINSKRKTTEDISEVMANLDLKKTPNKKGINPEPMINDLNINEFYEDSSDDDDEEEGLIIPKFKKIKIFNCE